MSTIDINDFSTLSQANPQDWILIAQSGGGAHGKMQVQLLVDAVKRLVSDGKTVNLRNQGGKIEWQHEGDNSWQELVPIETIKGDKGDKGDPGQSIKGDQGEPGLPLEFVWRGTELGVRIKGQGEYQYVNLKGETGAKGADGKMTFEELTEEQKQSLKGDKGEQGEPGLPLEFHWDGTRLGVRVQGQESYQYVDLKGKAGAKGANGNDGAKGADGKSAYQQAQEAGYTGSEQEFIAVLLESARNVGSNTVTTLTNLPTNKRIIIANLSTATNITLSSELSVGQEMIISINPTANIKQPIPTSGGWVSLDGAELDIKSGKTAEINILCVESNKYVVSSKTSKQ